MSGGPAQSDLLALQDEFHIQLVFADCVYAREATSADTCVRVGGQNVSAPNGPQGGSDFCGNGKKTSGTRFA